VNAIVSATAKATEILGHELRIRGVMVLKDSAKAVVTGGGTRGGGWGNKVRPKAAKILGLSSVRQMALNGRTVGAEMLVNVELVSKITDDGGVLVIRIKK
jgi:hypothetical protein